MFECVETHESLRPAFVYMIASPVKEAVHRRNKAYGKEEDANAEGTRKAWSESTKRANILADRQGSEKVACAKVEKKQNSSEANVKRSATWESTREYVLLGFLAKLVPQISRV